MLYREFTKDKLKISSLGFGTMRFPLKDINDNKTIDEEKSLELLKYAYDNGINYFDTAYNYHGGKSEGFLGKAIKNFNREDIYIATKLPMWLCKSYDDYEKIFSEQLERLETDYIDFYLTHSLTRKTFEAMKENNVFKFLDKLKKDKKIRYAGFSFHDNIDVFKEIVDAYNWDFCQIQLNYMDEDYQAGLEGLRYAKSKGLDIIIMEPVKGGRLAEGPKEFTDIFKKSNLNYSPAQWALRYVYDNPDISLLLSGMSNLEQLKENIDLASNMAENNLTIKDKEIIGEARDFFKSRSKIDCTSCEYCMPCPENIMIPQIFQIYNNASIYDEYNKQREDYLEFIEIGRDASKCVECGHCESMCPQHLEIIDGLKDADKYFK